MLAPQLRAMPVHTPAQLVLRPFVFQYLEGVGVQNRDAYLSGGVQKIKTGTPMIGGVHFFCASHAQWRCQFLLFQPLHGQSARFAHGLTNWHSHAVWHSFRSQATPKLSNTLQRKAKQSKAMLSTAKQRNAKQRNAKQRKAKAKANAKAQQSKAKQSRSKNCTSKRSKA